MTAAVPSWVVVSGAGGAIGRALTERYMAAGRQVLALDVSEDSLAELKNKTNVKFECCDLAVHEHVKAALSRSIPRGQPIGLFVNAVGFICNEPVLALQGSKFSPHRQETWDQVIRANLTAAFIGASNVAALMARRGGGAIVNFSSISSAGNSGQAAYSAAKAGIEGMTKAMAQELGPIGIRVNAIAPGFIDVPTTRAAVSQTGLDNYVQRTPLRRLGAFEELASAVDLLESNAFINGVILKIDGGLRL